MATFLVADRVASRAKSNIGESIVEAASRDLVPEALQVTGFRRVLIFCSAIPQTHVV
jgi:hypothetical protein